MKTKMWKRILSLVLAIVMVAPTVLDLLPDLGQTVKAEGTLIDNGTMAPNYAGNGLLVNGIYQIKLAGTNLAMEKTTDGGTGVKLQPVSDGSNYQRWIIEYGGSAVVRGSESHWYTIRSVATGTLISQGGDSKVSSSAKTVDMDSNKQTYYKWRLLFNSETKTYSIFCWGQHNNGSDADWNGYITPFSVAAGSELKGTNTATKWEIEMVPIQDYTTGTYTYRLEEGTYRVTNSGRYWDAIVGVGIDAAQNGLGLNAMEEKDGTQLYQLDWSSNGYVTVFDAYTGRYVGDRLGYTAVYNGAIAELGDDPGNMFDDRLRFYWTVIPVYTENGRTGEYYLCNVLTGRCMYITGSSVMTDKIQRSPWTFTKLDADAVYKENPNQGYNGNTDVYLDSINHSDTVKLPIKIYDYVNDGMLFEYAQYVGTSQTETIADKLYRLGNNRAFAFQAGSNGGSWVGISSGYKSGGNEADAWNTYKTFTLGKVWAQFSDASDWYTVDGSANTTVNTGQRNEYSWEAYGLTTFRGFPDRVLDPDSASVYYMYGYNEDYPQGIGAGKPTYNKDGVTNTFDPTLYQSDRMSIWKESYLPTSGYEYSLYGYISGHTTIGMVQPTLRTVVSNGVTYRVPEYRDVVVEYLADLLSKSLYVKKTNTFTLDANNQIVWNGTETAYNYVAGSTHERYMGTGNNQRDFAAWLRARCGINNALKSGDKSEIKIGNYDDTLNKVTGAATNSNGSKACLIGTWDECKSSIETLCDAAYFMLNNLFVSGSYNEEQELFDYLELTSVKVDDSDGNIVDAYVFDSGFTTGGTTASGSSSAVYYDLEEKTIRNTAVTGKASAFIDSGTPVCAHPFLPIWETLNQDTQTGTQAGTKSPYLKDDGVTGGLNDTATYANRNYNYVLASNGEFQFSYDDELFFNFEGDDDVYLYINGQLVLDIGGAHAITGFKINLNDYVDAARQAIANGTATDRDRALALVDGGIYSFDFYYMERHGWGSNMRIVTNIRVVEKGMLVDKDGAQFGADLDTNDIVDPEAPVEYTFGLTNSGTEDLIWPTFVDSNIGVTISYNNGLTVTSATNGVTVMDKNGGTLDVTDLVVTYTNPKTGNTSTRTFQTNADLIAYLTNELIIETQEKATPPFGRLTISGIYYKLTEEQVKKGVFRNTVDVTAHIRNTASNSGSKYPVNVSTGTPTTTTQTLAGAPVNGLVDGAITIPGGDTNRIWPNITGPGFSITPDAGLVIPGDSNVKDSTGGTLDVLDLVFTYTDPDGNVTVKTFTDNQELMEYLKNELVMEPGSTLTMEGIHFQTTEESFSADVQITTSQRDDAASTDSSNDDTGEPLEDSANFTVFVPNEPKYYHWRDHEMVISHAVLTEDIKKLIHDVDNPLSTMFRPEVKTIISVALADENGNPIQSDEIWVEGMDVHVKYQTTGTKLIYLNIGYTYYNNSTTKTATATIPVQIFVVDTQSYVYVLDYGLRVELTYDQLFSSDVLTVPKRDTKFEIYGVDNERNTPVYANNNVENFVRFFNTLTGTPAWGWASSGDIDGSVEIMSDNRGDDTYMIYRPQNLMDGRDYVYVGIRVSEKDYDTTEDNFNITDIRNEAEMFKTVTFMPANVVYYEDDYPALNVVQTGSFTTNSEHNQAQSSDQDVQYGYDDVYAGSEDVTMSGGTFATVTIGQTQDDGTVVSTGASFNFKGTGFEFISRTNAIDSATVEVVVTDAAGNVKYYPVITKFDQQSNGAGGDEQIYQVPVFRLDGLEYGEYDVVIRGIPKIIGIQKDENGQYVRDENGRFVYEYQTSYLYIDGIRIYNPLGTGSITEYGDENGAEFNELRTLVFDDKAAIISLTSGTDGEPALTGTFGRHYSFTENLYAGEDRKWFETSVGGLDQFIISGPNNEVYLDGTGNVYAVVLYVKETEQDTKGLLNIGVHDLHDDAYYADGNVNDSSSISYWLNCEKWITPIEVGQSGTEQYYAIDYRNCPTVEMAGQTYYSVVIQVRSGMVSFTNVKSVGLTFASLGSLTENIHYQYDENGVLCQGTKDADGNITNLTPVTHTFIDIENGGTEQQEYNVLMADLFSLRRALMTTATADGPEIEQPEIPEDTTPGDDVPEDTTPGETTPEDTTPDIDTPTEEIPETGDMSWWEFLLDGLLGLFAFFFEA